MAFVKLDCGILHSTLWMDRASREVFITALLLAEPKQVEAPTPALALDRNEESGFTVPAGWYGFVRAAAPGILAAARVEEGEGAAALERLAAPDHQSRTPDYDGRRLVRVSGGFIVLNFFKYRDRDHTAAERQRRLRARKKITRDRL